MGDRDEYDRQIAAQKERYSFGFSQEPPIKPPTQTPARTAAVLKDELGDEIKDEVQSTAAQAFNVAVLQAKQQNAGAKPLTLSYLSAEDEPEDEPNVLERAATFAARLEAEAKKEAEARKEAEKKLEQRKLNIIDLGIIRSKYEYDKSYGGPAFTTEINRLLRGLTIKKAKSGKAITGDNKAFILKTKKEFDDYADPRIRQKVGKITYQYLTNAEDKRVLTNFLNFYVAYKLLLTLSTNPLVVAAVGGDVSDRLNQTFSTLVDVDDMALRIFLKLIDNYITNGYTQEGDIKQNRRAEYKAFFDSLEKEPKQ